MLGIDRINTLLFTLIAFMSTFVAAQNCIGVIPAGGGNQFWSDVEAGANAAGKELATAIYFRGPKDEERQEAQRNAIHIFKKMGCKALVLAPDTQERAHDVALLKQQDIPTIYIDRDPGGAEVVAVVGTDNVAAGKLAGREMANRLHGKGNILVFQVVQGVASTDMRTAGFTETSAQGGLHIVDVIYLGSSIGAARQRCADAIRRYRGHIDGIFTPNESTTMAAYLTLRNEKTDKHLIHIGFDTNDTLNIALKNGEIDGLVVQRPYEMGYIAVKLAAKAAEKLPIQNRFVDTGVQYLTK